MCADLHPALVLQGIHTDSCTMLADYTYVNSLMSHIDPPLKNRVFITNIFSKNEFGKKMLLFIVIIWEQVLHRPNPTIIRIITVSLLCEYKE